MNTPPDRHDHRGTSEPTQRGHGSDPSLTAAELGLAVAAPAKDARETPEADAPAESGLTRRLKSLLPWSTDTDPVSALIRTHKGIHPDADTGLVRRAYEMAERMHRGQMRKSGDPFITHPVAVAAILSDLGMDTVTLVAAMLHDTVEDTSYTVAALESDFGPEVALIVDGLTKFDKLFFGEAAEAETLRKLIIAAGRDVRVLVIKLADRLHNMRTLDARSTKSQQRIATATRDVLVPLCDRLGIQVLKRELEDCVLKALSPSGYALITEYLAQREGWNEYLDRAKTVFTQELRAGRVDCKITVRPRHLYSIWKDTVAGRHSEPHDLPRLVVRVDGGDMDCYAALGVIHGRWRPVPGRFKDFIASPKNNLYRSLHTTVIGPDGRSVEVLIRTREMHLSAEYGVAVNFRYPEGMGGYGPAARAEQLEWLQRLLDWESAAAEPGQFLASLRCDLSESQIIVFTGTGRPVLLPSDSTPVDLAYTLSADTGNRCIGSRINGRLVPLSSPLADGDSVEIITRQDADDERGPSEEWLTFVKTPHARLHIGRWFEKRSETVTIANKVRLGRVAVGLALRQHGRGLASDLPLVRLAGQLGFPDLETLLVAVADHKVSANTVVDRLIRAVDHSPQ
ncbi:RelA/SpoT family protein [Virgisporangium ochraceum]|uniref:RelA/SpoT family protein n=1 Tax=Virgisporangium ochraceum TaxID=65505 RepID=UPI0019427344